MNDRRIRQIVELLSNSKTHYQEHAGHAVDASRLHHAAELAIGVLSAAFDDTPGEHFEQQLSAILVDAQEHPDEFLSGESSRRPWHGEGARFEEAVTKAITPLRDGNAVHLELGAYTTWPDEAVAGYVERERLGDFIRLDMNPDYAIDIAASVTALPFADETIDRIYSNSLLEHVAYPNEIIAEAYRVLRPGGVLVTATPFQYTEHRVPADYLRFTGQFFEHACLDAGFENIVTDTKSCSGAYYTANRLLKSGIVMPPENHPAAHAAVTAHLTALMLLGCLRSMDNLFHSGSESLFTETRAVAVKPGAYRGRARASRGGSFLDRFLDDLICPETGLPLMREKDSLVSLDGARRYPIEKGVPNLFVMHGFGSGYRHKASSADQAARHRQRGVAA
jgi:SAM-dependent methyltransferase